MNPGRIKPYIDEAELHLRRADHQVFVSLKYTRTGDVIINSINRILEAFEAMINALLVLAQKEGHIQEIPENNVEKLRIIKKLYKDQVVEDNLKLYKFLKAFMKSKIEAVDEYRKNVRIIGVVNHQETFIDIETITNYYLVTKELLKYLKEKAQKYLDEEKEEDKNGIVVY